MQGCGVMVMTRSSSTRAVQGCGVRVITGPRSTKAMQGVWGVGDDLVH